MIRTTMTINDKSDSNNIKNNNENDNANTNTLIIHDNKGQKQE